MTCEEAKEFVSVLHDGEPVPAEFVDHYRACSVCKLRLESYAQIGSELRRIASSISENTAPPMPSLPSRSRAFVFLGRGVVLPRFAVMLLGAALLAATISLVVVRAQGPARPLWFQFQLDASADHDRGGMQHVAQAGYDDGTATWLGSPSTVVATHIRIVSVDENKVQVALRSRRLSPETARMFHAKRDLQDLPIYTFIPGQTLLIPVEGGGTEELRGKVTETQPTIAFGEPLEADAGQLRLAIPILISRNEVLYDLAGASASTDERAQNDSIRMYDPRGGLFTFALRSFPGAVKGEANWGMLKFQIAGESYSLRSATPITGGDQPHELWIRRDADYVPEDQQMKRGFIGTMPLREAEQAR